ncbi:MAG TPA: hypothetical protein VM490_00710 [Armatimonadaceae bacterium]|jgi:hypothetical protein|nr:hypothetical protein [Armatimonadaceae bacterium]
MSEEMTELPEGTEAAEATRSAEAPRGVSRRDFLRRASREAVQTGSKIVPGAAIARVVLGDGPEPTAAEPGTGAEGSDAPATTRPHRGPLWKVMASWRQKRMEGGES